MLRRAKQAHYSGFFLQNIIFFLRYLSVSSLDRRLNTEDAHIGEERETGKLDTELQRCSELASNCSC